MLGPRHAAHRALPLVAPIVLAIASAGFTVWQNLHVAALVDIAYIVNIATRIAAGDAPYADFPLAQAPVSFLLQALLIKTFGPYYPVQIAYAAVVGGVATALTYTIVHQLLRGVVARPQALALILTAPLVPLGIYGSFPHPFYDSDACLAVLASIAAILAARRRPTARRWLMAGMLLTVPVFVKQNIGGAYLVLALAALAADALSRPAARVGLCWFVGGVASSLALEIFALQLVIGIDNYLRWALGFAMTGRGLAAERLGAFSDARMVWPGLVLLLVVLISQRLPPRARGALFVAALPVPFVAWSQAPAPAFVARELFPPVLIAASVLAIVRVARDGPAFESVLPVVLLATTAGALMSQGLGGSTYGIFPLLVLSTASLVRDIARFIDRPVPLARLTGVAVAVLLGLSGTAYVLTNAALLFVDVNAPGHPARSSFPTLAGLSARGPYIGDLDAILFWVRDNVPSEEPMVFLPGEDPVFFALGRPPRMPSVYFFDVASPYSPAEIAEFADRVDLRWVFVKDRLQLRGEPPLNQAYIAALTERATFVARVSAYRIYRR